MHNPAAGFAAFYGTVQGWMSPSAGVMNRSLGPEYLAAKPLIGSGIGYRPQIACFAGQVYQMGMGLSTTGIGGIATGQIVLQPLSDPYAGSS